MGSLQQRLDDFKKAFDSGAPPLNAPREAIDKMHRATAELKATGIENRALKVGDRAPSFTLFNQDHEEVASTELLSRACCQLLPRSLVILLQYGAGGSTGYPFAGHSTRSADRCPHPGAGTLHSRPAQEAEFDLRHSDRPAPEGGGAVSACVHASGLLARPVQIIWDRTRQVP